MMEGKKIAEKHTEALGLKLTKNDLPASVPWGETVTHSTVAPFSDKLMMFLTTALIGISIGYYGLSIGTTLRKDITADYVRLSAEAIKYAAEGAKIMIDNGWMEEPPQAADRDQLAKQKGN
ncbi:MAG TPA: DUF3231 family protein [Bacillales bacterium]|nr:DUF3231 family protein [Bacillales bacterium]